MCWLKLTFWLDSRYLHSSLWYQNSQNSHTGLVPMLSYLQLKFEYAVYFRYGCHYVAWNHIPGVAKWKAESWINQPWIVWIGYKSFKPWQVVTNWLFIRASSSSPQHGLLNDFLLVRVTRTTTWVPFRLHAYTFSYVRGPCCSTHLPER